MPYIPFGSKTEKSSINQKLVGAYLDKEDAIYLHLFALYKDKSISEILREIVSIYIEDKEGKEYIIGCVAQNAHEDWKQWFFKNKGKVGWKSPEQVSLRWNDFKNTAIQNLQKRKIPVNIIQEIIDKMEKLEYTTDEE